MQPRRVFVLFALVLLMEMLAAYSVLLGTDLLSFTRPGLAFFWVMVPVAWLGALLGLLSATYAPSAASHRAIVVAGVLIGAAIPTWLLSSSTNVAIPTLLLLMAVYGRGVMLTRELPSYDNVRFRFGLGFALYFVGTIMVIARGAAFNTLWHSLVLSGIAYVLVSMIALTVARLEAESEPGAELAVLGALLLQILVLAVLALAVLEVLQFNLYGDTVAATHPVWHAIGRGIYDFLYWISSPIPKLIALLNSHHAAESAARTGRARGFPTPVPYHVIRRPPPRLNLTWLPPVLLFLVALVIVAAIGRSVARLPRQHLSRGYNERRRFMLTGSDIMRAIRALWRRLLRKGSDTVEQARAAAMRRIRGDFPEDPMRRVYAQLLHRAAHEGLSRQSSTTPLEFQHELSHRWPAASGHFEAVTSGYMERRYNESDLPESYVAQMQRHAAAAHELMEIRPGTDQSFG